MQNQQMQTATCAGVSDSLIGCPSKRKRIEAIFTPCQHEKFTFHSGNICRKSVDQHEIKLVPIITKD